MFNSFQLKTTNRYQGCEKALSVTLTTLEHDLTLACKRNNHTYSLMAAKFSGHIVIIMAKKYECLKLN